MCIYNGIIFSHKEGKLIWFSGKWMEIEISMLSEISQTHKNKYLMWNL
jgi:hypothetical protein